MEEPFDKVVVDESTTTDDGVVVDDVVSIKCDGVAGWM